MGNVKVGGLRTSSDRAPSPGGAESNPQPQKRFKWEFQSAKAALQLSLEERIEHFTPRGTVIEERPKTKAGTYKDTVRFADYYFGTNDDDLAKAMQSHSKYALPGEGGLFWLKDELVKVQREARAAELRRELEDPEIARLVALKPTESEDLKVPPIA